MAAIANGDLILLRLDKLEEEFRKFREESAKEREENAKEREKNAKVHEDFMKRFDDERKIREKEKIEKEADAARMQKEWDDGHFLEYARQALWFHKGDRCGLKALKAE